MKKFKFTLDAVHKVREIRQDKERVILSELRAEADKARQKIVEIEMKQSDAIENYTRRLTAGESLDAIELELSANHIRSLDRLQKEAESELEQREFACSRQIEVVTNAMREVKTTANLRDKQIERHQLEYARQEQNTVDELVSTAFARRTVQTK